MTKTKRQRIARTKNRIKRLRARLAACDEIKSDEPRRLTLQQIVSGCDAPGLDFDALRDRVEDWLDKKIEPKNPILEWLSDVGIDIVADAAVAIYRNTQHRLEQRLERNIALLERLTR